LVTLASTAAVYVASSAIMWTVFFAVAVAHGWPEVTFFGQLSDKIRLIIFFIRYPA
jgi:hypothetical protein